MAVRWWLRRLDLFVEDQVVVKSSGSHLLTNDKRAQVINYLKATSAPVDLLFNLAAGPWVSCFPSQPAGSVNAAMRSYSKKDRPFEKPSTNKGSALIRVFVPIRGWFRLKPSTGQARIQNKFSIRVFVSHSDGFSA
jgi:hypothetical protein